MRDFESLTERGKVQRYRKALNEALHHYPVQVTDLRFVSSESKPVFRVVTGSGSYAAKFHDPSEHVLTQMMGEMEFLGHVSRHSELRTEEPLANGRGEFITEIRSDWLPEPAHVALCSWLPGKQLKDAISTNSYRHLGRCAALLHGVSPSFRPGPEFAILTNDRVFYWDEETLLSRDDDELLPKERQDLFRKGARLVLSAIESIWSSGTPMVIHNDLHPCNVNVYRGALSLYDFEDITWGFPEQDIGTALYHVRFRDDYVELLAAFREGYEQIARWPLDSDQQLDRFVAARMLMFANYVVNFDIRPATYLAEFETRLHSLLGGQTT